jgi:hypothetical protein
MRMENATFECLVHLETASLEIPLLHYRDRTELHGPLFAYRLPLRPRIYYYPTNFKQQYTPPRFEHMVIFLRPYLALEMYGWAFPLRTRRANGEILVGKSKESKESILETMS